MSTKDVTLPYYDYGPLMSRNATFNFVVGGRGLGKTYGAKLMAIKHFLQRGDQFIYLRRYKSEQTGRGTFFDDIVNDPWVARKHMEFRVNGNVAECRPAGDDRGKWVTMGFFTQLSTANTSKSVAYPNVKLIIFDEFIILKGAVRYLPDEAKAFQEFYSTVDRWKDKTRVLFLANAISIMNPYFTTWGIEPKQDDEWVSKADGYMLAHFPQAKAFQSAVYKTKFGKFIAGTEYADYSIGNFFKDNSTALIREKPSRARYLFTLETPQGKLSVWQDMFDPNVPNVVYYCLSTSPANEKIFTMDYDAMQDGKTYIEYGNKILVYLRSAFSKNRCFFDRPSTRNAFGGVFTR